MSLSGLSSATRLVALTAMLGTSSWAQQSPSALPQTPQPAPVQTSQQLGFKDYSKPRSAFPNVITPLHATAGGSAEPEQYAAH